MTIVFPPISKLAKFHFYTCSLLSSLHTYIFYSKALNSFIHIQYKKIFKIIFISNWFLTILLSSLTSSILINNTHSNLLKNHSPSSNSQFNQLNLPQILISLSLYMYIYIYTSIHVIFQSRILLQRILCVVWLNPAIRPFTCTYLTLHVAQGPLSLSIMEND